MIFKLDAKVPHHVDGIYMKLDVGQERMMERRENTLDPGSVVLAGQINDEGITARPTNIDKAILERVVGVVFEKLLVVREMSRYTWKPTYLGDWVLASFFRRLIHKFQSDLNSLGRGEEGEQPRV